MGARMGISFGKLGGKTPVFRGKVEAAFVRIG